MKNLSAHLALFTVALFYAGNYTVAKEVMPNYVQPFGLVLLRATTAVVFFWIAGFFKKEKLKREDIKWFFACAMFGVVINMLTFLKGLNWTTPINASLIMLTSPIIVLLVSVLMKTEKLTKQKILGMVLGCLGAGILIAYGTQVSFNSNGRLGDFLVFINATSYALYLVLVKQLTSKYNPFTIGKWVFTIGWFFLIPFGLGEVLEVEWSAMPISIFGALAYVLVLVTVFNYFLNLFALGKVSASIVSAYIYLQPILAAVIALSFGKDTMTIEKLISSVLIFLGVYLVSKQPKKKLS